MNSHSDNAVDGAETDSKVTRGPRPKFFFCVAGKNKVIKPEHLICQPIEASSEEEAIEAFTAKYDVSPVVIDGGQNMNEIGGGSGYYLAKGTGMSDAQRISVTVSAEQMSQHTATRVKAEFRGWLCWGNGIKGFGEYEDDELVQLLFANPIDKTNKVAKPKLKKNEAVRMSDLKIL